MNRSVKLFVPALVVVCAAVLVAFKLRVGRPDAPTFWRYKIVNTFPHDPQAWTQGLVFEDGFLFEGTGLPGRSQLRKVELRTGNVVQQHALRDEFFGEGITIWGSRIIQLTYQSRVGFVYDKESFQPRREFHYPTEGWGITYDGERLIMSDGTSTLHFLDPETFKEISSVQVFDDSGTVVNLNELEYVNGEIFANVWLTDHIAMIDPSTGRVLGWIDLTGLLSAEDLSQPVNVLNGIAYDAEHDRLFVTGKLLPKLFEIKLVPKDLLKPSHSK